MDVNDWLVEERVLRRESEGVSRFEVCETDRRSVAWYRETTTFSWQKPVLRTTTRRRVVTEHHNTITSPPTCAKRLKQRVDPTRMAAAFRIPHMLEAKPPCRPRCPLQHNASLAITTHIPHAHVQTTPRKRCSKGFIQRLSGSPDGPLLFGRYPVKTLFKEIILA